MTILIRPLNRQCTYEMPVDRRVVPGNQSKHGDILKENQAKRDVIAPVTRFCRALVWILVFLVLGAMFLRFVSELLNRDRFEVARRSECRANLRRISEELKQHHLEITTENADQIRSLLADIGLSCPSAKKGQGTSMLDGLYVLTQLDNNSVVITESSRNHDPHRFFFVSLSHVQNRLGANYQVCAGPPIFTSSNRGKLLRTE